MPNHVRNNLVVTGEEAEVKAFIKLCVGEAKSPYNDDMQPFLDFNTIIPCHEDLHKAESPRRTGLDLHRLRTSDDPDPEQIAQLMAQVKLADDNEKKYGYANWYDFCCSEWGTKWGAYDCHIEQDEKGVFGMSFNTAWSPATPIFQKLAQMFPILTFNLSFIEEGYGIAGRQIWANDGFTEDIREGMQDIAEFANEEFGGEYIACAKCEDWFDPSWQEEGDDENLCPECNEKREEAKDA